MNRDDSAQIDWVSPPAPPPPFQDLKNMRPSSTEAKALAAWELGQLINRIPPRVKSGGSVNEVRNWRDAREAAAKVAKNSRASLNDLRSAIGRMEPYFKELAQ